MVNPVLVGSLLKNIHQGQTKVTSRSNTRKEGRASFASKRKSELQHNEKMSDSLKRTEAGHCTWVNILRHKLFFKIFFWVEVSKNKHKLVVGGGGGGGGLAWQQRIARKSLLGSAA